MNYTLEEIYILVGKDDKTAGLTFKYESESYKKYGSFVNVIFLYTQNEREEMDQIVKNEPFFNHGQLKVKYLGTELTEDKIRMLNAEGVNSQDIAEILYFIFPQKNTFHSVEKKNLNKINIEMRSMPKGGDFDWMYGFSKKLIYEGIGQSPKEISFYLAGKLYYDQDNLTDEDRQNIFNENGDIFDSVEWEYLRMKYIREDISDDEKQRLQVLVGIKTRDSFQILDKYLKDAGSSVKKLSDDNPDKAAELFYKVLHFKERRLNVLGKYPIYLDIDGFLHIYLRHVEEYQVNKKFEHKDNFSWDEEDVFSLMGHVVKEIENEYQKYREERPEKRYSRYGSQNIYFQGDYYTLHIEQNGRIDTFHRNGKEYEKGTKKI